MDIQISYWNENTGLACTRYFSSQFMYRPNANNLVDALIEALEVFPKKNWTNFSMDGSSTNWALF